MVRIHAESLPKGKIIQERDDRRMKKKILGLVIISVVAVSSFMLGASQARKETVVPEQYVDTTLYEFYNNYIDMREVIDFKATENKLYLYTRDGSEYSWYR